MEFRDRFYDPTREPNDKRSKNVVLLYRHCSLLSMAKSERRSYGIAFGRSPVCANDRAGGAALEKSPFLLGAASKADQRSD